MKMESFYSLVLEILMKLGKVKEKDFQLIFPYYLEQITKCF